MAYAAEHDGYHVRGDFPPPFGPGRSAQPLAKAGGEACQNMERQCAKLMNLSAEKTGSNMHTRVSLPTCEQGLCGWRILTQDLRHTLVLSLKTVGKMGLYIYIIY